ncbi:hypothetical protein INR49_005008 [Caranx melampygus]|nr:hypothetical protein INR49_005008 [Caranx melampygus]
MQIDWNFSRTPQGQGRGPGKQWPRIRADHYSFRLQQHCEPPSFPAWAGLDTGTPEWIEIQANGLGWLDPLPLLDVHCVWYPPHP